MELQKTIHNKGYKKDTEKGQKIVAAGYLITRHLSDTDPLKDKVRAQIVSFICASGATLESLRYSVEILLGGASMAGLISEKNTSILIYEMKRYAEGELSSLRDGEGVLEALFPTNTPERTSALLPDKPNQSHVFYKGHDKGQISPTMSFKDSHGNIKDNHKSAERTMNKVSRQDSILALINDKKSAVIKDIVALFPDVSEKTIQRELNTLIDTGRITKRGSKRWSIYMAVNKLL